MTATVIQFPRQGCAPKRKRSKPVPEGAADALAELRRAMVQALGDMIEAYNKAELRIIGSSPPSA
jgi:hypothetical protein